MVDFFDDSESVVNEDKDVSDLFDAIPDDFKPAKPKKGGRPKKDSASGTKDAAPVFQVEDEKIPMTINVLRDALEFVEKFTADHKLTGDAIMALVKLGIPKKIAPEYANFLMKTSYYKILYKKENVNIENTSPEQLTSNMIMKHMLAVVNSSDLETAKIQGLRELYRMMKDEEDARNNFEGSRPVILLPSEEVELYDEAYRTGTLEQAVLELENQQPTK